MDIEKFLKTIYLGDRGLKSVLIDAWNSEVKLKVTCISRVRSETWNFYTDEDLPDGSLVFEGVKGIAFNPGDLMPNDMINDVRAVPLIGNAAKYLILISVDSV